MITPLKAKEIFLAVKLHFTSSGYDYVKYCGKINAAAVRVGAKESHHLERLVRKFPDKNVIRDFFVANLISSFQKTSNISTYLPNYITPEGVVVYNLWEAWMNSKEYNIKQELASLGPVKIKDLIISKSGDHPLLMKKFLRNEISANLAAMILISYPAIFKYWSKLDLDPVMKNFVEIMQRYCRILDVDRKIVKKMITENIGHVV